MTIQLGDTSTRLHPSRIKLRYNWWLGAVASKFYQEIKEKRKIWGIKCPTCKCVYVPPKKNCPKCFSEMHEWVEVSNEGFLTNYTVIHYSVPSIQPQNPPFALGIVQLDGADSGIVHMLGEADLNDLQIGIRVSAVFRKSRLGNLLDIKYFKPI
ncbi:MAG: Zn-ribbon domain-containing OB-fold protein [Deltaproteobacteria bacterium]|nr:Zn-ribbon domain-containing OB-fold protein [Deltaproteobacteria bacterium]